VIAPSVNHILAFSDIRLTTENFTNVGRQITWLKLDQCNSNEWYQILQRVANLTEVTQLRIMRCGLRDEDLQPLSNMTHLQELVLGTMRLT
jgi:hypothetical protein